jgi:AraC family transcriptional regulator
MADYSMIQNLSWQDCALTDDIVYRQPSIHHHGAHTLVAYEDAVKQAIRVMYQRFDEPLSLQEMADAALFSPDHFNRVFQRVTGITPCHFLCAIRLQAALRLLLTTQRSVTEVCFAVGYNSLGTFTSRFTQLVGLPPTQLRELVAKAPAMLELLAHHCENPSTAVPATSGVHGCVTVADVNGGAAYQAAIGVLFIGLFSTAIPQGSPVACTVLTTPGLYQIRVVPDGRYYLFAVAFPQSADPLTYLLPDYNTLRVGAGRDTLRVYDNQVEGCPDLTLRPVALTDPPLLSAIPLLLSQQHKME